MMDIERLADVFVEVADTLIDDFDMIEFLHLVSLRVSELSSSSLVGLVLADEHGSLHFMGASHQAAQALELIQLQRDEGPCLDCFRSGERVVNQDIGSALERWPIFAPQAVAMGIQWVHAFPLRLRSKVIGALNVFGGPDQALSHDEIRVIQALADIATISLIHEQAVSRAEILNAQLQAALNSRIVIEQAKGAVARTFGVTVDEAFELMRSNARRGRTPLTDLARELVTQPELISSLR